MAIAAAAAAVAIAAAAAVLLLLLLLRALLLSPLLLLLLEDLTSLKQLRVRLASAQSSASEYLELIGKGEREWELCAAWGPKVGQARTALNGLKSSSKFWSVWALDSHSTFLAYCKTLNVVEKAAEVKYRGTIEKGICKLEQIVADVEQAGHLAAKHMDS